ncbi:MAG: biopolymer transporter ExbD [Spirochaetales bacterium]|nr:biopolymer transporter ExbD [Spirochaetales bacterium]
MIEFNDFDESWTSRGRFDMTPMIDMIFLLLIFFLLTSTLSKPVITVDLPESEITETRVEQEIIVAVERDGGLFLNEVEYSREALKTELTRIYSERETNDIFIQADEKVDFGIVVDVMDICRGSGAIDLSFLVDEKAAQ